MQQELNPAGLGTADLEAVYDRLAQAIDDVGPGHSELMLTKLVLVLAQKLGDQSVVVAAVGAASADL